MRFSPVFRVLFVPALLTGSVALFWSCGGGSEGTTGTGGGGGNSNADWITLSVDGAPEVTYTEASGLPAIDCDPRVDWGANQVVFWQNFTAGNGPNGYERFMDVLFPAVDTVGTYTVQGDYCQVLFYNGINFGAGPQWNTSTGTVQVTRSDTRIEGTYTFVVVDVDETTSHTLTGSFGIDAGFSLSCP
jgi:hypothetical protein